MTCGLRISQSPVLVAGSGSNDLDDQLVAGIQPRRRCNYSRHLMRMPAFCFYKTVRGFCTLIYDVL